MDELCCIIGVEINHVAEVPLHELSLLLLSVDVHKWFVSDLDGVGKGESLTWLLLDINLELLDILFTRLCFIILIR